jgi:sugar lactone lactonase YvrE
MTAPALAGTPTSFIGHLSHLKNIVSTVPGNGDVNPYGVAVVRHSRGMLHRGDVLVSNFNNRANLQGTGSTIVEISPGGHRTLFAHITKSELTGPCPGGVGLSTALAVLPGGWVVVGSTPSKDGMAATAKAGCLIVLDSHGTVRETISGHGINGPWDMTALSFDGQFAELFVTNVLNGTVAANGKVVHRGTVLRLVVRLFSQRPPRVLAVTRIGSGFFEQTSASAFVIGPTGVGLGRDGTLYVADTGESRITGIPHAITRMTSAGTGFVLTSGGRLNAPLGLAIAPNGDVLTVNGGDGLIVETTPGGAQIAHRFLDKSGSPPGSGALFGLAVAPHGSGVYYVDDATNFLRLLH